jgi:hemolysin activation/secretion protein
MNANRYRLIFDKKTGMLIPVAEFTTSAKKSDSVYGDQGIYVSNTMSTAIGSGFSGFVGVDIGTVKNSLPNAKRDVISGWALGLRGNWKHASVALTYAEPIQTVRPSDREVLYATASVRF